ncbi:hypothetical protein Cs7R123_60460 [Catellatospora sp. TT07R-123]|uniref:DUF4190 domain-containing protein n=1 Tax=Catellatospora sp. TT07R-123 TaxID=2733863 RepID=UPI001B114DBF|nr:DUF4190 domain-containing protein [Catellatospora sp. TT07R-123]GHJ48704.1 hypothetical protein Cs7R123_60460 [Catellatospora sp. TT07R-123]
MTDPYSTPPPYQQPPYQPQPPYNVYAILSLVLALFVFPPLGIYFGTQAKKQIAVSGERGIELAQVGIIVGWVLTAFMLLACLIPCAFSGVYTAFFAAIFGSAASGAPGGF